MFRIARPDEVPALTELINLAYEVEKFFKITPRTTEREVASLLASADFLVREEEGALVGCAHVAVRGDRGKLALLAVHAARKGQGIGKRLVAAAEDRCRALGCRTMELSVVNLRAELPPFYRALGYREFGTAPFPDTEASFLPCHLVVMSKDL